MQTHSWNSRQAKSAQTPNFGKKYIGEPNLLKLLGSLDRKNILELGSGNGYWLELLASKSKTVRLTGIEKEPKQLQLAQQGKFAECITYIQGDITQLKKLPLKSKSFDLVLLEHVLLEIPTRKKLEQVFTGAYQLLKNGGSIIVADLHPFAPSVVANITTKRDYHYFSSGDVFEIYSRRLDGKKTVYRDVHWTLEDIVQSMTKAGFAITALLEPRPTVAQAKRHPELAYRLTKPMSLMIKAQKI
ncbi:MAG: class I SAM-dependent methyltransferase [Candidatus Buchananbacteria bacterium]|nr:class I SAM-dependent methyltransferase [Candidatus Buchananbacteria bacterium]